MTRIISTPSTSTVSSRSNASPSGWSWRTSSALLYVPAGNSTSAPAPGAPHGMSTSSRTGTRTVFLPSGSGAGSTDGSAGALPHAYAPVTVYGAIAATVGDANGQTCASTTSSAAAGGSVGATYASGL